MYKCNDYYIFNVQVIFTDETAVEVQKNRIQHVWRVPSEKIRDVHTERRRAFHKKIVFWGAISILGTGQLVPVNRTIKSSNYIEILKIHLIPAAERWYGSSDWKFIQDNAPCHDSKMTRAFIETENIHAIPWPSNSPDLNVIENVWALFKAKLYQSGRGDSRDDVIRHAQDIWQNDPQMTEMCFACVSSMTSRIQQVIHNHGQSCFH
jgi:hypothetical protein